MDEPALLCRYVGMGRWDWLISGMCGAWLLALLWISVPEHHLFRMLWTETAAAWVQVVGSVGAVCVAIWIAHSDARRAADAASQAHLQTVQQSEEALDEAVRLVRNCNDYVRGCSKRRENWEVETVDRLIRNARDMLGVYLRQPPTPNLAFWLIAATNLLNPLHNEIGELQQILSRRASDVPGMLAQRLRVEEALNDAAENMGFLLTEYHGG